MAVTLTYRCLKQTCGIEFDTQNSAAKCPKCKTRRVQWLPVRVSIAKVRQQADQIMREAAQHYNVTDFRSARQGESMRLPRAPDPPGAQLTKYKRADGHGAAVWTDKTGRVMNNSTCVPAGLTVPTHVTMGQKLPATGPGPERHTVVTHRHSARLPL